MTDISEFTNLYQEENEKLFEQGIWLAQHCVDKKSEAEIKAACGIECGASADTINKRLRVGRTFGHDYYVDCNWSLHVAACELANVDHKKPETVAKAFEYMQTAIEGYVDENGNRRPHTARTLKAAIRAANGDGKPSKAETVYRGEATVKGYHFTFGSGQRIRDLILDLSDMPGDFHQGETVTVTITRVPSPATATAAEAESEVAA